LKFNTGQPVITIKARPALLYETVAAKLDPKWNYLKLTFTDNGIGFEPHYSEQIFTIFQRLNTRQKFSGTGIGLAMCKKIIDNHNGYINASSEPGKGATFLIYIPLR
jgi:signal transduction histidine kinase